ncbi:hypothetical protein [Duganella sp. FT27W]|uniref:hypothetical protein n=1 Tax=Duganella sp. FT27W TaxID=2654636 RepID=UPI00128BF542|nr:hypothetical protein [Duganella sp. FT27W]MPQ56290.1 hypothetical protein [Duganella sp. FT27W]
MSRNFYDTIPKSVRIGSYDFKVVVMPNFEQASDTVYGDMNAVLQRIRICDDLAPARLANTFMHEVMHAIHMFYGVGDKTIEEDTTFLTTNGLCAFWMNNPEAAAWWVDCVLNAPQKHENTETKK